MEGETSKGILGEGTSRLLRSGLMGIIHGNVALLNKTEIQMITGGQIVGEIHGVGNRGRIIILGQES